MEPHAFQLPEAATLSYRRSRNALSAQRFDRSTKLRFPRCSASPAISVAEPSGLKFALSCLGEMEQYA